ncbi:MAG: hypothetical protein RMJ98_17555 [Myxococcales bacterium]|nr:hypothetical protein [Polyangiaceae bacterium]MDW8251102.1 hypothetical protein [Myxococcales bacterium]
MATKRTPKPIKTVPAAEEPAPEEPSAEVELNKAERAKLERMGEAFHKIDRLLFRLAQQGLQRMSRSSSDELRALEQIAHNAALISIERQIETLATHVQRYLDKDPLFRMEDYMATINKVWLLTAMARKRHAAGQTPEQMMDVIGEARRSYTELADPLVVQPLGAIGWVSDTDFVGITVYFFVKDRPGVIYQASNCKPCAYFGRDPQRLLHEPISEYVHHSIFDMAHGAYEFRRAKVSSDGRMSLHKDMLVVKAPYLGARAYQSIAVRNWVELVERLRSSELHPVGGGEATLVYIEPSLYGNLKIDEKHARATVEVLDARAAVLHVEVPLRQENNLLVDNLERLLGKRDNAGHSPTAQKRRVVKSAGPPLKTPTALFGRATVNEGRLKLFPITALYNTALVHRHDRRVNELHLTLEDVSEYSLSEN